MTGKAEGREAVIAVARDRLTAERAATNPSAHLLTRDEAIFVAVAVATLLFKLVLDLRMNVH